MGAQGRVAAICQMTVLCQDDFRGSTNEVVVAHGEGRDMDQRPKSAPMTHPAATANGVQLPVGKYRFVFAADPAARLPAFAGSAWRGAFGHALKRAVCVTRLHHCLTLTASFIAVVSIRTSSRPHRRCTPKRCAGTRRRHIPS